MNMKIIWFLPIAICVASISGNVMRRGGTRPTLDATATDRDNNTNTKLLAVC